MSTKLDVYKGVQECIPHLLAILAMNRKEGEQWDIDHPSVQIPTFIRIRLRSGEAIVSEQIKLENPHKDFIINTMRSMRETASGQAPATSDEQDFVKRLQDICVI